MPGAGVVVIQREGNAMHAYLIRYRRNGQAMSTVLLQESLSHEQAQKFVRALHGPVGRESRADIQVSQVLCTH